MAGPSKYPQELRERAVRMVLESRADYPSEFEAHWVDPGSRDLLEFPAGSVPGQKLMPNDDGRCRTGGPPCRAARAVAPDVPERMRCAPGRSWPDQPGLLGARQTATTEPGLGPSATAQPSSKILIIAVARGQRREETRRCDLRGDGRCSR